MQILTAQELHNLAMNIVGKKLEKMGYEFQAINSQLKRHPQFVLFKKGEPTIFVLVKATNNLQNPNEYDTIWMETFLAPSMLTGDSITLAVLLIIIDFNSSFL